MQVTLPDNLIEEMSQYIALDNKSEALATIVQEWIKYQKSLAHTQRSNLNQKSRPIGLAKDKFQVPTSFFEPLPDEILADFEGK
jgi:hypothetical protein